MVSASTWLTNCVQDSALMHEWRIQQIPHLVDTNFFTPKSQAESQRALHIPSKRHAALFLSSGGIDDERKGWSLLESALPNVVQRFPDLLLVVVGPTPSSERQRQVEAKSNTDILWFGPAQTSSALRELYTSADVIVAPSIEDNLPLTVMEAQSCARVTVGFEVGGLPDLIQDSVTGFLAKPFRSDELAASICKALDFPSIGQAARDFALRTWSPKVVYKQYELLYESLYSSWSANRSLSE